MNRTIFQKSLVTSMLHFDEHPSLLKNISNTDTSKLWHVQNPSSNIPVEDQLAVRGNSFALCIEYAEAIFIRVGICMRYANGKQKVGFLFGLPSSPPLQNKICHENVFMTRQ